MFRPPRRRAHSGKRVSSAKHRGKSIDLPARPQLQRGVSARARLRPTTAGIYRGSRRTNAAVSTRTTRNRRAHSLERAANAPIPSDSPSGSAAVQQSRGDGGVSATDVLPTPSRTNNRPQSPEINMGKVFSIMRNLGLEDGVSEQIYGDAVRELLRLWEKANIPRWERYKILKDCTVPNNTKATLYRVIDNIDLVQQHMRAQTTLNATIEQRQSYVMLLRSSLRRMHKSKRQLKGLKLTDVLFTLRMCSLKVVESFVRWRRSLARPMPAMHRGGDYLSTMKTDLSFLFNAPNAKLMCAHGLVVPDPTLMQVAPGAHRLMLKSQHKDNHISQRLKAAHDFLKNYSTQQPVSPSGMATTLVSIGSLPPGALAQLTRAQAFPVTPTESAGAAPSGRPHAATEVVASCSVLGSRNGYYVVECAPTATRDGVSTARLRVYRPAHPSAPDATIDASLPSDECSARCCQALSKRLIVTEDEEGGITLSLSTLVTEVHITIVRAILRSQKSLTQCIASNSDVSALLNSGKSSSKGSGSRLAAIRKRLQKRKGVKKFSQRLQVRVCNGDNTCHILAHTGNHIGSTKLPVWNTDIKFPTSQDEKLQLEIVETGRNKRPDRVVAIGRMSASALISADTAAFVWVKLHAPVAPSDTNTTEDEGAAGAPIGNFGDNNDGGEGEVDCSIGEIQLQLQDVDEREAPTQQMQAKAHGGGKVERAMRRGVEREMGRRATSSHRDWRLKKVRDA